MEGRTKTGDIDNIIRRPLRRPFLFDLVRQQLGSTPILLGGALGAANTIM
jgi:hypothetical protein